MKKYFFIFLMFFIFPLPAKGFVYFWQKKPQNERLVFEFSKTEPKPKVYRTGIKQLTIQLSPEILKKEPLPAPVDLSFSYLIKEVILRRPNIIIKTKTPAFGFISIWKKDEHRLYIDIFYDPLGKKWKPIAKTTKNKTSPSTKQKPKTKTIPKPKKNQKKSPVPKPQKQILLKPKNTVSSPTVSQRPKPANQSQVKSKITPVSFNSSLSSASVPQEPLYKLRAKIRHVDITKAVVIRPSRPNKPTSNEDQQPPISSNLGKQDLNQQNASKELSLPSQKITNQTVEKTTPPNAASAPSEGQNNNATVPDFQSILINAKASIANGELDAALEALKGIVNHPKLPDNLKEDTYYTYADLLYTLYKDKFPDHFEEVLSAYKRAINYNPKSPQVPKGLLRLGYINLKVNNLPEARGYFNLLRKKYPYSPETPLTYFYWGDYYFQHQQYQKAADLFQTFITKYPDHKIAQTAAIELAKSLKELQYYKQALEIVDYIEQRWPRYYLKRPYFLLDAAYLYYKNKKLNPAKTHYLLYYNLLPDGKKVDVALARIGDIYLLEHHKQAAKKIYELTASKFPDKEGGLIAAMRLAEEGIYDKPSIKDMFSIFNRPYNLRPEKIYTKIIKKHPDSPLASLAKIKLAIWELFNNRPLKSLDVLADFFKHPPEELKTKALEVAAKNFAILLKKYLPTHNYKQIFKLQKAYPFLKQALKYLNDEQRLLLANAYIESNQIEKGLAIILPFLNKDPKLKITQDALALALTVYLKLEDWSKIIKLGKKIKNWPLSKRQREQIDFALALAYEKLKQFDKSIPLWRKIASDINIVPKKRAYALYFLANHYAEKRDWENVYIFAQEALSIFLEKFKNTEQDKIIVCLKLLIQATDITGRTTEALGWALELKKILPKNSPLYPSFLYQLANLYKENGDNNGWKNTLQELITKKPDSLYAQMAKEDLSLVKLKREIQQFEPKTP
ncbi:MAG: tetratricopeptide repeat protein [Desulfonauticus sp.]|nr:tetratricopeptide repeat protein [Desulfonauticus sp.]